LPLPIITPSWKDARRQIARKLGDNIDGTASGGTVTTLTDTGDIARYPTSPQFLLGTELTFFDADGFGVYTQHVTTHAQAGGTVTLTFPTAPVAPVSGDEYEIHKISGRGFSRYQYDDAMNQAIYSLSDQYWTDADAIPFGIERGIGVDNHQGVTRYEYPMPSGFLYLAGIDYLGINASTLYPYANADTYRALGDATARTRLTQGFKVNQSGWYEYLSVAMNKVGSPTDNLTAAIHTDSSGIASGTVITDGTSDTVLGSGLDERTRYVVFRFNPPIYLTGGTQYHFVLARSTSVNASNYYRLAEDSSGSYSDGTAGTYNASIYAAVSASDFCFALFTASTRWLPLRHKVDWEYRRVGSDTLYIQRLPNEGAPVRLRGGAALSAASIGSSATTVTEATAITIPPEYMISFAIKHLLGDRVGRSLSDNYGQALQAAMSVIDKPKPRRALPPNVVMVHA
jgi:hypothetical protein